MEHENAKEKPHPSRRHFEKAVPGAVVPDCFWLAATLGVSRKTLSKIVNEGGGITPDMALRLSKAFNTTPELWLNLQRNYDLREAAHKSNDWKLVEAIAV